MLETGLPKDSDALAEKVKVISFPNNAAFICNVKPFVHKNSDEKSVLEKTKEFRIYTRQEQLQFLLLNILPPSFI